MPWGRQTGYHNIRDQVDDEQQGEGFFAWARRQIEALLKSGGDPSPATILYTHAIDDELNAARSQSRERPGSFAPHALIEDPLR